MTFNLGNFYTIEKFALWNASDIAAINNFELFANSDNDFSNANKTLLGTFNANLVPNDSLAQIFSFAATQTQFVHLNILSNHGRDGFISAGEVAFAQVPFEFGPIPGIIGIVAVIGIVRLVLCERSG